MNLKEEKISIFSLFIMVSLWSGFTFLMITSGNITIKDLENNTNF